MPIRAESNKHTDSVDHAVSPSIDRLYITEVNTVESDGYLFVSGSTARM